MFFSFYGSPGHLANTWLLANTSSSPTQMHRKNNHYLLLALLFHFQNVITVTVFVNIHKHPKEVGSVRGGILHVSVEKTEIRGFKHVV